MKTDISTMKKTEKIPNKPGELNHSLARIAKGAGIVFIGMVIGYQ